MLTTIAIIVAVITFIALLCILITPPGHVTLIGIVGAKPEKVAGPGISFIFRPFELPVETVSTERVNFNIDSSKVICTIDPISRKKLSLLKNGITELEVKEISVTYQFFFGDPTNPDKLNAYFELTNLGKSAQETIKEMLKDMVQSHLRDEIRDDGLLEAIAAQHETINNVRQRVRDECDIRKLPIQVIDIAMNEPMKPTEERIRKAMEDISVARIELAAAEKIKNLQEFNADRDLIIKRKEAEAKRAELNVLAERWGVNKLPDEKQAAFWLSQEGIAAYREMAKNAKATVVVSSNILAEVEKMLSHFSGGK